MRWRWDQGRLPYFQFENICRMANVLCGIDGISLRTREDLLRRPLETYTELPFAPAHYKVWRNYARVFQCAMLATEIDGKTDCHRRMPQTDKQCTFHPGRIPQLRVLPFQVAIPRL